MSLNAYLYFDGNCAEAFAFYRKIFGGDFLAMRHYRDAPPEYNFADDEADKVMHATLPIGQSLLMGADMTNNALQKPVSGTNFSLSHNPSSHEEADRIFAELKDGGDEMMAMQETFWGAYFGMVKDRFGIQWLINYNQQEPTTQ